MSIPICTERASRNEERRCAVMKLNKSEEANTPIPAPAMLGTRSAEKWKNGIQVNELNELETLSIETMNHTYEVTVINPPTAEVLILDSRTERYMRIRSGCWRRSNKSCGAENGDRGFLTTPSAPAAQPPLLRKEGSQGHLIDCR